LSIEATDIIGIVQKSSHTIALLPKSALIRTSHVDHADWNFRPLLGLIQRKRFSLILDLLGGRQFDRLLEVGYGSGVFMPELAKRCGELYGIDPHEKHRAVEEALAAHHVTARLCSGTVEKLPFAVAFFDAVISVSAMEYVEEIEAACRELERVLRPGGVLVIVTPGHTPIIDLGLKLLTGESPQRNYANRRERLLPTLERFFKVDERRLIPRVGNSILHFYTALRLQRRA